MEIEESIHETLKTKLEELPWAVTVEYERVKVATDDFREHDIPAIQFYDNSWTISHEHGRVRKELNISVEVVLKSSSSGEIFQGDLFEKIGDIERKIGENTNLDNLAGVIHTRYTGGITDLHTILPYYYARLDFVVEYYKDFTGC